SRGAGPRLTATGSTPGRAARPPVKGEDALRRPSRAKGLTALVRANARMRRHSRARRRHLWGLLPLVLYLSAFTLGPVVSTLLLGFRDAKGHWGLGALRTIASHYQFNDAVVNTLTITGLGLSLELGL